MTLASSFGDRPSGERRDARLAVLREALRRWEGQPCSSDDETDSDGETRPFDALEELLPEGGFRRGALVEWLGETAGGGQETLAFAAACRVLEEGGAFVVVDVDRTFYPPAAAAWGADPRSIVVVRPRDDREALWAFDQALRCPAVSIVWGRMERLPGRSYRRLQLSAEEGGVTGFLLRSTRTLAHAAWCDWSVLVKPFPTGKKPRYRVELVRSRDGKTGRSAEIELDQHDGSIRRTNDSDETPPLHLVPEVDDSASPRRTRVVRTERLA